MAVHIISGGNDAEQRRDGDYLDHDQRYARTDAFLDIVRRVDQRAAGGYSQRFLSGRAGPSAIRPLQNRIFRSILAARRKRPSPSPANMPTSSPCGASRWRKPARPSSGCAPKRRNTSVISASASRSGRLSPTAKPKHGRKPSISCTSPPSRRRSAGRFQSQTGEHRRPAAAGYCGAGQSGGQTPVDRHRPAGGRRT